MRYYLIALARDDYGYYDLELLPFDTKEDAETAGHEGVRQGYYQHFSILLGAPVNG